MSVCYLLQKRHSGALLNLFLASGIALVLKNASVVQHMAVPLAAATAHVQCALVQQNSCWHCINR